MKKKIIALLPMRGGSKGIKNKNIKLFKNKPLCLWALESVLKCKLIDEVYVSTDSMRIKKIVKKFNEKIFVIDRNPNLAKDNTSTESVMLDFIKNRDFDILILVQVTSPFLSTHDLDGAINKFYKFNFDSLFSSVRLKRFFWTDKLKPINYDPFNRPRRQSFKGTLVENGSFYITKSNILKKFKNRLGGKIGTYEMSEKNFYELDNIIDWKILSIIN